MHSSHVSTDITRKSFWTQRLQAAESAPTTPGFFDQATIPRAQTSVEMVDAYQRTALAAAVNSANLKVAACMHHLSEDAIILAAWAILLRSYAGEDGPVSFGACLDREQAAWMFAMTVTGDERLLSAMRSAEEEKKLVLDHSLTFESLGDFAESTGYGDIATAVYIHSGDPTAADMHLPVSKSVTLTLISFFALTSSCSRWQPSSSTSPIARWCRCISTSAMTPYLRIGLRASWTILATSSAR